jgi:lantibiotic modifying enzyme
MEVVDSVACRLMEHPATAPAAGAAPRDVGLPIGLSGVALLFTYWDRAAPGQGYGDAACALIDEAVDAVAAVPMNPSLFGGFTGVAWVVEHLCGGRLFDSDAEDPNQQVDEALEQVLDHWPRAAGYDLMGGLTGVGLYALDRLPRPTAATCLRKVVERLAERAERQAEGITWFTPPEFLPAWQRELAPTGYYNVGVAHGVPGVIALLADRGTRHAADPLAGELLAGALRWLLAQRLEGGGSVFPDWVGARREGHNTRWGWCYGDQGIAAALLSAARSSCSSELRELAIETGLAAAGRDPATSRVVDAGLCHGACGLGHMFNRLYQATGEDRLRRAATDWFERALEMREPTNGLAGFRIWNGLEWVDDPGFLMGIAGTALALLAAATSIEPAWDRALLLSASSPGSVAR